jgi:hypothetical protein
LEGESFHKNTPDDENPLRTRATKVSVSTIPAMLRAAWRSSMMVVISRFAIQNSSNRCAYCGQPFKEHLYAWRSSSGKLYCSEFCADDEEEANFQNMRRAHCTSSGLS